MKFHPRDEFEREAFDIEPPEFDLGQPVYAAINGNQIETKITEIHLRTIDRPLWQYRVTDYELLLENWQLLPILRT